MADSTYALTVTENQLRVLQIALESYFRTRMGQFWDFADEVAEYGYTYDKANPDNDRLFNDYIHRRDESLTLFEQAYRAACPSPHSKTADMNVAIDLWSAIRYYRWNERPEPKPYDTVESRHPYQTSGEPMVQIKKKLLKLFLPQMGGP